MKRLIITACIVIIAAAGMAGTGCEGSGKIKISDPTNATATADGVLDVREAALDSGSVASSVGECDPVIITNRVIEVAGGSEEETAEPEGQTCLMSRVPNDAGVVVSVDRSAQKIVEAAVDHMELTDDEKADALQKILVPFDQLDLEELVGFATFKYIDGDMKKPDGACRDCMDQNLPACLPAARTECASYRPSPDDMDRCDWERVTEGSITPACDGWRGKCGEQCSEEKPEPESIGILVRWLSLDGDADGTQKMVDLKDFIEELNQMILDGEYASWLKECFEDDKVTPKYDENGDELCVNKPKPTELKPDQEMQVEQIDTTVALVHSAAARPNVIEPVRICKYIRFDGIGTRPAVYGELLDMKLLLKIKPSEAFTETTRDSRKIVSGIDLKEQHYRLYAGVVDKDSLATGAFVSSVINLGDDFGLELWKQMMLGLSNMD